MLDLADGTTRPAMGIQGSDGDRARRASAQLRALLDPLTAAGSASARMPQDADSSSPGSPGGRQRDAGPRRERNASAGAVIGSTASDRRAVAGTSSAL